MKQIQKPAHHINLMFLIALLPWIILFSYFTGKASAATVLENRTVQCYNAFIGYEYNPKLETQCRWKWDFWTRQIKKSFNQK